MGQDIAVCWCVRDIPCETSSPHSQPPSSARPTCHRALQEAPLPDWIQGYTGIALVGEVFMFSISFLWTGFLWNGRIHRCLDLLV